MDTLPHFSHFTATTFPTNESDWSRKVNKVRRIFVKPWAGEKTAKFFDSNSGKTIKYENWNTYTKTM